jgi:hypothetical protein
MRCSEFESRLQLLLDQRKVPERDSQLVAHTQVCSHCQEVLSLQSHLFDVLEMTEVPELPQGFAESVVARVVPSVMAHPTPTPNRMAPILLALAASLVLGLFSAGVIWISSERAQVAQEEPVMAPSAQDAVELETRDGDNWWRISPSSLATLYPSDVRQRHRQRVETIADELKPITTPFTTAATALRRTIPVGRKSEDNQPQAAVPNIWPRELS